MEIIRSACFLIISMLIEVFDNHLNGVRTRIFAVKGQLPSQLVDEALMRLMRLELTWALPARLKVVCHTIRRQTQILTNVFS